MGNQIIISISREYGSEGHTIAKQIAKDLGLPFYDRNMLDEIAKEKGFENTIFLADDGYSGTNFERPSWKKTWR